MPTVMKKQVNTDLKEDKVLTKIVKVKKTAPKESVAKPSTLTAVSKEDTFGKLFNSPSNPSLVAQYVRVYNFNQRQGGAHTKTRGDVAGSGKKPWKQKGTGRSRVGSIRNPVWRHGGVSHGPVAKDWSLDLPEKMKRLAFKVALSEKVSGSKVFYLDKIDLTEGRTSEILSHLGNWKLKGKILIVTGSKNSNLLSATGNLKHIQVVNYDMLNAHQVLSNRNVLFEKSALDKIAEKYDQNK